MVTITGPIHRLTVEDVCRMVAAGVLEENARVELVQGVLLVARLPRSELPATVHLVIEIPQTSHARDLEKARDYAVADVTEYWIVDLPGRSVSVHRCPLAGAYQEVATFADGVEIKPLLADAPAVDVTALLG